MASAGRRVAWNWRRNGEVLNSVEEKKSYEIGAAGNQSMAYLVIIIFCRPSIQSVSCELSLNAVFCSCRSEADLYFPWNNPYRLLSRENTWKKGLAEIMPEEMKKRKLKEEEEKKKAVSKPLWKKLAKAEEHWREATEISYIWKLREMAACRKLAAQRRSVKENSPRQKKAAAAGAIVRRRRSNINR
jgi:hypothetical protein